MNNDTAQRLKDIKQSFRMLMDGSIAASMRDKGHDYHLSWGVTIPRLQAMAADIGKDYDLAIALWKENIRECKILATLVMPADEVLPEVIDIWVEQIHYQEIAEQCAFNLFQHLPYAADKAFQWIADPGEMQQLCGYLTIARLFFAGKEPNERAMHEFTDQAETALHSPSLAVRKAAAGALRRFAGLGLVYERIADNIFSHL